jgi:hypothetical protein
MVQYNKTIGGGFSLIRIVHGSEDSLDVDVFYVFDQMPSFFDCQTFCSADPSENRNIITIEDGVVSGCFKGTIDEINNGLIKTYPLHKQKDKNPIRCPVERDMLIKSIRVMRCLLSHCSRTAYRSEVKKALKSSDWQLRLDTLRKIDFSSLSDFQKDSRENVLKVFAFQVGQLLGLFNNLELYTKSSTAATFPVLKPFLYREKNSDSHALQNMINRCIDEISKIKYEQYENYVYFTDFDKKFDLAKEKYI